MVLQENKKLHKFQKFKPSISTITTPFPRYLSEGAMEE